MSLLRKVFAKLIGTNDEEIGSFNNSLNTHDASVDIARGKIEGSIPFGAYGKLVSGGAVTNNVIWANGTWEAPPAIGVRLSIVSTSIEDSVGGTGIRTVEVHYLDTNLEIQTESITMNGTTAVLTTATDIRFVQCAHMVTFGSTKASVGVITFNNSATAVTYNQMDAQSNRCSSSARMVPKGKRALIMGLVGSSVSGNAAASTAISMATSFFGGHDYTADSVLIPFGSIGVEDGSEAYTLPVPAVYKEGHIVAMVCSSDKVATITGDWFGWLEDDI